MQSLLQFRRMGQTVQAQVQRDLEKAQHITIRPQPAVTETQTATPEPRPQSSHSEIQQQADQREEEEKEQKEKENALEPTASNDSSSSSDSSVSSAEGDNVDIERVATAATAHTQYTARAALGHSLTGIHARDRRTHEGKGEQVFVVGWEGESDPLNPRNWSHVRRIGVTFQIAAIAFVVTAASAIDATILPQGAVALGVSEVTETLATAMYLIGFGVGSLVAGPFSETFGRNIVYMGSLMVWMIWIMASALAPNIGAQIVFRFLAGFCGSTPLVCAGGSISDIYNPIEKTYGFPMFATTAFGGPILAPVIGSYIGQSSLISWRWSEWIMLITGALVLVLILLCMPETYSPLLLQWKAAHFRRITGDDRFRSEHEIVTATLFTRLKVALTRPFLMATEPIIAVMMLYLTVIYVVLFTFLDGYTFIFEETYHTSQGLANVIFAAMFVGILLALIMVPIVYRKTVNELERVRAKGATHINPEIRLWFAMLGAAPAIPIGLFWMGWTDYENISIWSPIISSVLIGYGIIGIFLSAYMYVIDSYEMYSASALTFIALVRYLAAGGMTVVGVPFYKNMGTHYTCTILACIAAVLVPTPYVLYKYGHLIRAKSKYAVSREVN
ncbi:uncharacterized protein K452DRAFT_325166 [Aplosporella prunicola CBS 121167]|uniref:Major facilitator superfamily (MFS) profile domain-containing protein n=1 Tax=Aplosporella prunicola CBS 121167 TaxID=1176127 RepID=A0A6A6BKK0_9PEZI|nr:uncharacterized protein K452DRAFT_325166 [Aplosporella prunicola CBS 121167]KAF2144652.1 hypothetical protein K452DRAFT_325166 [Aplosporella prunicola CBS 121167]